MTWTAAYFAMFTALAWWRPLSRGRRWRATLLGIAGGSAALAEPLLPAQVGVWLPAPLMLLAYWQAGQYFVTPDAGWQEMLLRVDRRLGLPWRVPAFIEAILELAYALCYAMVPAGLGALLLAGGLEHAASYWRMVLPPAYSCYALVPLLPMLPPRALETLAPPQTALRRFNLWVAARGSIHANTFPSAHVAASLAVALALLRFAPAAGWVFLVIAAGIAMGAVVGRYHYALDAVLGAALVALAAVIES